MTGLIIPYSPANPYQAELIKNLAKLNIDIAFSSINKRLSVFKNRKAYRKYDFIHLHWTHSFMIGKNKYNSLLMCMRFITDLFILRVINVKIIWTVHNLTNHDGRNVNIEKFFLSIIARYLVNDIIVHSKSIAVDIKRVYKIPTRKNSKINIIPHGNYKDYYRNQVDKETARRFLNLERGMFVYLFIGLIRDYKGVGYLIEQFKKSEIKNSKLLIAGMVFPNCKKTIDSLRNSIEGNANIITNFSYIPDDLIQYYLNAADVVVLPYTSISTSGSLILAMSFNKAVIIPNLGFVSEVMDSNGGIVYDPSIENALADAIREIRYKDVHKMGINNGCLMQDSYEWSEIAYRTKLVYEK